MFFLSIIRKKLHISGNRPGLLMGLLAAGWLLCGAADPSLAGKLTFGEPVKTVVIDPGHGGYDTGARGPGGALEKDVVLVVARMVAAACGDDYRVVLTRTGDYHLDLFDRTAVANHLRADLFVSIHTGGSFLHQAEGIAIYHHVRDDPPPTDADTAPGNRPADAIGPLRWDRIQDRHQAASRQLAEHVRRHMVLHLSPGADRILGLALPVLEGADMPAILVEVGYLTHGATEKSLADTAYLTALAQAIRSGIDDFFAATDRP